MALRRACRTVCVTLSTFTRSKLFCRCTSFIKLVPGESLWTWDAEECGVLEKISNFGVSVFMLRGVECLVSVVLAELPCSCHLVICSSVIVYSLFTGPDFVT